jgi:uncharacterized membrane protein (UPF0127 family)
MAGIRAQILGFAGLAAVSLVVTGASFAMSAKPDSHKVAKANLPAACQHMDIAPYSPPQGLEITSATRKSHFQVEIASNAKEQEQGLMCRTALKPGEGMLFEFNDVDERSFWMQNTLIGLDIIFIAPDGRIVSIQKDAKPMDTTPLPSNGKASGVLEIPAGLSDKLGLQPGDLVDHPFFHGD